MTTSLDDAIRSLRADASAADVVRDGYLDEDWDAASERYRTSGEFDAVRHHVGDVRGKVILDVGAGRAISTHAFASLGAAVSVALEPDASDLVGYGDARGRVTSGAPVVILAGLADSLPLPDHSVDVVFCRQVLHHVSDLEAAMQEFFRVLKPGGRGIFCREHVADTDTELAEFLVNHPVHRLAGGEHAWPLDYYLTSIAGSGLRLVATLGPWGSVLNAYPVVRDEPELASYPTLILRRRFGSMGAVVAAVPGIKALVRRRVNRPFGGRLYSFIAESPVEGDA